MNGPSLFSFGSKYFKGVLALILAATFTTSPLLADFKDDIDYTKLKNEYGSGLPSGSGVKLAQIEYIRGGYWAPSATGELAGKSFTYVTDTFGGYSTHANEVGAYLSGNVTSVTPGVAGWSCFEATNYCGSQSLMIGISAAPIVATWDVENHSWVGNDISFCVETLKRMDYRIERDNVIAVVGLDNGAATPLSNMMANAYNVIAVGTSTGDHPHGGSTLEVLGRQKPDLVGTATWTSYATPIVASSATLLVDETKRTTSLAQARHPLVIKALLMAGATKEEFSGWSHTSAQPLDAIYGAGEVNVYNSYKMLLAGRQQASSSSLLNISGWDTQTTTTTKKLYYINVPAGKTLQLSAVLAWYRHVQPDSGWNTLVSVVNNLNLTLWNADSSYNLLSKVSESLSTIDNVEHIYEKTLGAGVYALEVVAPVAGEKYGLAWRGVYSDGTTSVNVAPAITTQPVAQTVTAGTSVTFSAAASGTPTPSYQWYKNGATISGATSASYTIASASLSDAATYTVVATNSVSSATSSGATLTVNVVTVAPAITTQPVAQSVVVGSGVTFNAAASGTPTPSYQWYKNGATISGATSASYTIASTSLSDAATYTVVATNSVSSATSNGATLTVSVATVAPAITTQPVSQTVTVGSSVTFSATASGTPTPSYQWYKNGATISGATGASYWISSVSLSDAATYTVVATNSVSSATSSGATLTVNVATVAPAITTQPIAQSVVVGSGVTFNAAASGTPTPSYQWYKNGATISGATSASYTIASTSLSDAATYTVVATNSVSSATSNGATLTVSTATVAPAITTQPVSQTVTAGSNVTFNVAASGTPTPSYQWYKNGAAISGAIGTSFWISGVSLSDAATYTVVATNSVSSATSSGATLTVNVATVAPAITTQPVAQSVVVGSSVTFNAAASGTPTPSYQWYKNGAAISGATSASYTIASTSLSDAATYAVVATNNVSSATSSGAILTVNVASVLPEGIMLKRVLGADQAGLQVMIHAIGDKANAVILDLYEDVIKTNGPRDRRFRVEHSQHLRRDDIARFGKQRVVASMQPYHCADDGRWCNKRIGPERSKGTYAFRSLLDSGAVLAFGSDWTVAPLNPMTGIKAAVTRQTLDGKNPNGWIPEQKITLDEAIRAYTVGSAYAEFQDQVKGSLAPGKLADLVLLDRDIYKIEPTDLDKVTVAMTIVDGKVVWEKR